MPQTAEELATRLRAITQPGVRGRLVARGLARGMIWRDGVLPPGASEFSRSLTTDLLDHGYSVLDQALRLRGLGGYGALVESSLLVAAECIESAVRKGMRDIERDFHLVVAAVAFHLARLSARSYCLAPSVRARDAAPPNLSTPERLLVGLMRRDLTEVRLTTTRWLRDASHSDEVIAQRLASPEDPMDVGAAEVTAITSNFARAVGLLLTALEEGDATALADARRRFDAGAEASAERQYVTLWWANVLARHLADDLWEYSLYSRLPADIPGPSGLRWSHLRQRFIDVLRSRRLAQIELWPSQLEAAQRAVQADDDLVVALPTSAGKTRIAELCILRAIADGKRVVYVTPLRALSAQLERGLAQTFRPLGCSVTALYGASGVAAADVGTMESATIVVATPEKLDFALRLDPSVLDDVGLVVLDEGHMIGLGDREFRYEVLVQRLLRRADAADRRIVCLSAIFSPGEAFDDFKSWLRSDSPGEAIRSEWRPTRQRAGVLFWRDGAGFLRFDYEEENPYVQQFVPPEPPGRGRRNAFPQNDDEFVLATAKRFVAEGQRVLVYCPLRGSVEKLARLCITLHRQRHLPNMLSDDADIERALRIGHEWLGDTHVAVRALRLGIAVHHGLLPRPFLAEIEDLLTKKQLRLAIASPTLAQGLDLSCSVLVFRSIYRGGDARGGKPISPSEFANVRGRAGRAFVDLDGFTVLPLYEYGNPPSRRYRDYRRLERQSRRREMESGLVQLVLGLAKRLADTLGVDTPTLLEQVANERLDWDLIQATIAENAAAIALGEAEEVATEDGTTPLKRFDEHVSALDVTILSSVDDLATPADRLAEALDAALDRSLWTRRLARAATDLRGLARALLINRARWVWQRTTTAQRRGYYAAGIGLTAGQYLDVHLRELVEQLVLAERALERGDLAAAMPFIVAVAEGLGTTPPFKFEHATENWRVVLEAWLSGRPLGGVVQEGDEVGFVQNDVVYRLVWGLEAVRIHALEQGVVGADAAEGILPLALTWGLPSRSGCLLAQAGLLSRELIAALLERFAPTFVTLDDVRAWVTEVDNQIPADFWRDSVAEGLWRDFVRAIVSSTDGEWRESEVEADVIWLTDATPPLPGTSLRVAVDSDEQVVYVCDRELEPIGRLAQPTRELLEGRGLRASSMVGRRVRVITFGPRR